MLGKRHPLIRRIRDLKRDPTLRRRERLYVAEGLHLALEAVRSSAAIESFVVSPRLSADDEGRELLGRLRGSGARVEETSDETLESIQDARSPQPVVGLLRFPADAGAAVRSVLAAAELVLVLDSIQDPGNLGSIVRSADAAGCDACFVIGRSADPLHPRAVRGAMGSVGRLWPRPAPSDELFGALAASGHRVVGSDPHDGAPYDAEDLTGRMALVLGGEAAGISRTARGRLTRTVRIPMRAGIDSLSVAAAGAVLLFEAARQRRR
ncbi:MAG TPA: RNA methyltransferase [Candidatus Polarisedimenticolaceae bacterium]|nr:RNA methyltransferase [Candidatus Polarisedimenticolaceae bacterium]